MIYTCIVKGTARHQIRRQGGTAHTKNEAHNPEQIGKARALATNEGRLDNQKDCSAELDEDILANVAGGKDTKTGKGKECEKSPDDKHKWVRWVR